MSGALIPEFRLYFMAVLFVAMIDWDFACPTGLKKMPIMFLSFFLYNLHVINTGIPGS